MRQESLDAWYDLGVRLVIVQAVNPPPGYPPRVFEQQMDMLIADGRFAIDVYVYLWHHALWLTERNLRLVDPYREHVRQMWLDCEDSDGAGFWTENVQDVRDGLALLDDYSSGLTGIYTGAWYWRQYVRDTAEFAVEYRPLWDADYDHVPDANFSYSMYGGWEWRDIKQYIGTSCLGGQCGVDQNVLSDSEADEVSYWLYPPEEPEPGEVPCSDLVNLVGYLSGDVADALAAEIAVARKLTRSSRMRGHLDQLFGLQQILRAAGDNL